MEPQLVVAVGAAKMARCAGRWPGRRTGRTTLAQAMTTRTRYRVDPAHAGATDRLGETEIGDELAVVASEVLAAAVIGER